MDEKRYTILYKEIFDIISDKTPLKGDCGTVCGKACCKGDSETGMLLFPHEQTSLIVIEKNGRRLAVCNGSCNRNERPLACRMFPFFPAVDGNGKITVVPDFRGVGICPLITHGSEVVFSRRFLYRLRKVGDLLMRDSECAEFLKEVSKDISAQRQLWELAKKGK